ncbi:MAG: hypothetical protein OEL83_14070 [Desulforhopalus sp.]|nr:hypothetical protein [Desulforhopalus sp.]
MRKYYLYPIILLIITIISTPSMASLKKWLKKEAIPTVKGERPIEIKPYVSIKNDNQFEFRAGPNDARIQVGNAKVQTHQLAKRLVQAGCVYVSGGDVVRCAPDIIERELLNISDGFDTNNPSTIPQSALPQYSNPVVNTSGPILRPGTVMQPCGCWGFSPSPIAFEPRCARSRVTVNACPGFCQFGGIPYSYVCM